MWKGSSRAMSSEDVRQAAREDLAERGRHIKWQTIEAWPLLQISFQLSCFCIFLIRSRFLLFMAVFGVMEPKLIIAHQGSGEVEVGR